ncbi:RluA family pseudouridine synthase [Roseovarius sp. TE539]|uniref:RluA family pseudouridine synthase n=1 Tax=Roseovarius sp. TE539 TaxID=2249812 RepID=UPI000DDD985A|nr:RluA family pseudouridine synthase [Roseovarius sp. TE539]RBI76046.1 RluA family pseudouridine synthase [Roseovarius sp. TE539]
MTSVQTMTVAPEDAGQRLDRWLRRQFPHVQQGRIERMCRKGELRVDGGRVKAGTRLAHGQQVRVPPLPDTANTRTAVRQKIDEADSAMIRDAVIYRDDQVIAINKPPGLAVQGGSGQTRHVDGLSEALRFGLEEKPRLVHRLDKDTSGVLIMARTRAVAAALTAAFRSRTTRKIYWAAVAGVPAPRTGTIRYGLVKAPGHGAKGEGEKMHCVHPDDVDRTQGARHAITDFTVLEAAASRCAWMALVPVTGRTHQLRAHMAEIGHPIIGDGKYGGSGQENPGDGWGAQLGGELSRKLHLHARSLTIRHPVTGAQLVLVAPLPAHMSRTWDVFQWQPGDVPDDPFSKIF